MEIGGGSCGDSISNEESKSVSLGIAMRVIKELRGRSGILSDSLVEERTESIAMKKPLNDDE